MRLRDLRAGDRGCLVLLIIAALTIGSGCLWGAGAGWMTFAAILLTLLVVAPVRRGQ